ncbi:hypothetical protein VK70_13775 [Paenibacillus durus ATCC 35681]|uniref:Uncharacterized protein n=1 Tax=Paenibacillus durus ATCC 35681 TaxID=1333534 RepID=A0A0F7FBC0_PAEDU|nr:hypothetical protein VK70_13775 [Paenibacillus durus ATCC 35681]
MSLQILYKLINRVWAFLQATVIATGYKRKQIQNICFSGSACLLPVQAFLLLLFVPVVIRVSINNTNKSEGPK